LLPVTTWPNTGSTSITNNVNDDSAEKRDGAAVASEGSSGGTELNYSVSLPENPKRANRILNNLANGHALLTGRNYVTLEDIPVVIKTALSTGPIDRVKLLSLLIAHKGELTTPLIVQSLNTSKYVARKTMTEFKAIGLVDMEIVRLDDNNQDTQYNNRVVAQITMKEKFNWLLDEKFEQLREGFEPQDYSGYVDSGSGGSRDRREREGQDPMPRQTQQNDSQGSQKVKEAANSITTTEKQSDFWKIYDELKTEQASDPDTTMGIDKHTVSGQELKKRLSASGQFFVDQATAIIEYMVKVTKQLEKVSFDTYRKVEK
jgi:hypothetical protein